MDKLTQLKEMLKDLSPEEVEELKTLINAKSTEETAPEESSEESDAPAPAEATEEAEPTQDAESTEEDAGESAPAVEPTEEVNSEDGDSTPADNSEESGTETSGEEDPEPNVEEPASEETPAEETATPLPPTEDDDIPMMKKGAEPAVDEDAMPESQHVTAETGEELPVDYEQIIEGLNAKVAALEAENASLKNRVEGAFGFSSKPSMPGKVNPLYDECDDVHFHK